MAYLVACGVAAALACVEQHNRLGARFTLRTPVWLFWLLRAGLEAAVAALVVTVVIRNVDGANTLIGWIAAGAAAPAILRSRFVDFGRGAAEQPYGVSSFYEPARAFLEGRIDFIGAAQQSRWLNMVVFPALTNTPPGAVAARLKDWLAGLDGMTADEKRSEVRWIDDTLAGPEDPGVKREVLIRRAMRLKAYEVVKHLVEDAAEAFDSG